MTILINYRIYLPNRDLLFKLDETNLILYTYIITSSIGLILVKDNTNYLIIIYKKDYREYNIKLPYNKYFYISIGLTDLTTRLSNK